MPIRHILNHQQRKDFDTPPYLNSFQRKQHFRNTGQIRKIVDSLRKPESKIGFVLICGYFEASGKVFNQFYEQDWRYASNLLGFQDIEFIDSIDRFVFRSLKEKCKKIYKLQDFSNQKEVLTTINLHLKSQQSDRYIFGKASDFMVKHRIVLPPYYALAQTILLERKRYDQKIEKKIKSSLSNYDKAKLETLFEKEGGKHIMPLLKKLDQSNKVSKIRDNLKKLNTLKELYGCIALLHSKLGFTDEGIKYYADMTIKQQFYQVVRRKSDTRLIYITCFIIHQYQTINDVLAHTIISTLQSFKNKVKSSQEKDYLKSREDQLVFNKVATKQINHFTSYLSKQKKIFENKSLPLQEKLELLENIHKQAMESMETGKDGEGKNETTQVLKSIESNKLTLADYKEKDTFFLTNRLKQIIMILEFNTTDPSTNHELIKAIEFYREKDGNLPAIINSVPIEPIQLLTPC